MSDIELDEIRSGYNLSKINSNFNKLEESVNNDLLNLSGGNNTMLQQLDMNSNKIINLPIPTTPSEPLRLGDLSGGFALLAEPYEVPPFSGSTFSLPDESAFVQVEVNGRVLPPSMITIGFDKRTITLDVPVDENDSVVARYTLLTEGKSLPIKTPYDFGALGDGIVDDTFAIKNWVAYSDGIRYGAPGVFLVSEEVLCDSNTVIVGAGSGSGTVGEQDNELQAAKGAFILKPTASFTGVSVLRFKDDVSSALYSCSVKNVKFDMTDSDVHSMLFEKAYDNLEVANINSMNLGDNSSAIFMKGNDDIASNRVSQTLYLSNIMGIHRNGTATQPTVVFDQCQEMTVIGLKAFAGFQAAPSACDAIELIDCRGVNLVGCSSAHGQGFGISIVARTRNVQGITIQGHTYENVAAGTLKVRGENGFRCSDVREYAPRFQFPQSVGFDVNSCDSGEFDASSRASILGSDTSQCEVKAQRQSTVTDQGDDNVVWSKKNALDAEVFVNQPLASTGYIAARDVYSRKTSSPIFQLLAGGSLEHSYTQKYNASTVGGAISTSWIMSEGGSQVGVLEHQKIGRLRITAGGSKTEFVVDSETGVPKRIGVNNGDVFTLNGTAIGTTGTFTSGDGKTVTVVGGIIKSIV